MLGSVRLRDRSPRGVSLSEPASRWQARPAAAAHQHAQFLQPRKHPVIRPTEPADTQPLLDLTTQTDVFKPHEIQALDEVLTDYHATNKNLGHRSVTFDQSGQILGFAYYAPAAMTDRTWYLYWIAVTKHTQARGIGGQLLKYVEDDIRGRRGRILLIETSSLPHYDLTRKFYVKHHYDQAAVIAGFYADGDNLVVFCKRITR
jgi:ribosomal protein S18 acetylase RimI-like enzyme